MANTDDDYVALCNDCLSVIPDNIAEKDPFLQAGEKGVCKFCHGPVTVVPKTEVERLRERRRNGGLI